MFEGTNLTLISDVDQNKYNLCLARIKDPLLIDVSFPSIYTSGKTIRTQQYIQLHTWVKEIQQLNPGGPDHSPTSGPNPIIYR